MTLTRPSGKSAGTCKEGLPNQEIAELLHLSLPAVMSRLHRGRLLMRHALAPHFEEVAS